MVRYRSLLLTLTCFSVLSGGSALADLVTVVSDASTQGAATDPSDPRITTGDISGLTFTPVAPGAYGTFTPLPPGSPTGTIVINLPPAPAPDPSDYATLGNSGLFLATFTLPTVYSNIQLAGLANVDDWGYAFLNGNPISSQLTEFGNVALGTTNAAFFQSGINTLVVTDYNTGGPSGAAFYANITFNATAVPEPSSLVIALGSSILLFAGVRGWRRRLA